MKIRDLFGLGVRLFGIGLICRGATYFASFADAKLYPPSERVRDSGTAYLIYATIDFSLAAFFLLWTRVVVAWSYGDQGGMSEAEPSAESVAAGPGQPG
jgi:hypothetical protein